MNTVIGIGVALASRGARQFSSSGRAVSPQSADLVAKLAVTKITQSPLRRGYAETMARERPNAMFSLMLTASTTYSVMPDDLYTKLESESARLALLRDENKAETLTKTPAVLKKAIQLANASKGRVKQKDARQERHFLENMESATRTNPDESKFFYDAIHRLFTEGNDQDRSELMNFAGVRPEELD